MCVVLGCELVAGLLESKCILVNALGLGRDVSISRMTIESVGAKIVCVH